MYLFVKIGVHVCYDLFSFLTTFSLLFHEWHYLFVLSAWYHLKILIWRTNNCLTRSILLSNSAATSAKTLPSIVTADPPSAFRFCLLKQMDFTYFVCKYSCKRHEVFLYLCYLCRFLSSSSALSPLCPFYCPVSLLFLLKRRQKYFS